MKILTDNLIRPRRFLNNNIVIPDFDRGSSCFRPRWTIFLLISGFYNLTSDIYLLTSAFMPNKPNFQPNRLSVTLDMIRTYNANCQKNRKKNKPKTHQKRTKIEKKRLKTNQNEPNSTPKTTPKTQFRGYPLRKFVLSEIKPMLEFDELNTNSRQIATRKNHRQFRPDKNVNKEKI